MRSEGLIALPPGVVGDAAPLSCFLRRMMEPLRWSGLVREAASDFLSLMSFFGGALEPCGWESAGRFFVEVDIVLLAGDWTSGASVAGVLEVSLLVLVVLGLRLKLSLRVPPGVGTASAVAEEGRRESVPCWVLSLSFIVAKRNWSYGRTIREG